MIQLNNRQAEIAAKYEHKIHNLLEVDSGTEYGDAAIALCYAAYYSDLICANDENTENLIDAFVFVSLAFKTIPDNRLIVDVVEKPTLFCGIFNTGKTKNLIADIYNKLKESGAYNEQ